MRDEDFFVGGQGTTPVGQRPWGDIGALEMNKYQLYYSRYYGAKIPQPSLLQQYYRYRLFGQMLLLSVDPL